MQTLPPDTPVMTENKKSGYQSEAVLENKLIQKLVEMGYKPANLPDERALIQNLRTQLEAHNKTSFSDTEFAQIQNTLAKGSSVFEKSKALRTKQEYVRDDGTTAYYHFLDTDHWCRNRFQVVQQVTMEGKYKNRYDVTLLINGLPLVQIELKRRGLELKEAFNQTGRYQKHSYGAGMGLFQYIQIFVISNGVNTKYYANNRKQSFKQTFFWSDKENQPKKELLDDFTPAFLEPCHLAKMVCKYIVLNQTDKILMVLRPYQYYAVEAIVDKVKNSNKNGYIWHTTGSGKTLTSFKASQIIRDMPEVDKVVFVVDRRDLDYQTIREFDAFSPGCVEANERTRDLVDKFGDDTKLIVTTLQKLNNAVTRRYKNRMEARASQSVVFIFDECHRSQFGDTHKTICEFFPKHQMFGFTGTPIFAENAAKNRLGKRTTKDLFGEALHKYVITDAIRDENVLRFSVEYIGRYRKKSSATLLDIEVEDIDRKELMDSPKRLEKIVDYIIANHPRKTYGSNAVARLQPCDSSASKAPALPQTKNQKPNFTGMFCVSNVETLIKYYEFFQEKKNQGLHKLTIGTIFSYQPNEADQDADGYFDNEEVTPHSREKLDEFIGHYNSRFNTKYSTKDPETFQNYYKDLSKRVKNREIDILLVVNMFLTGFDSKPLNTLYVDKNLKHHGLIQAYSRTNRILNEKKSQGNIVVFRNLKEATDKAITLFSNKDAVEEILMEPFENYLDYFEEAYRKLLSIAPTVDAVDRLPSEKEELDFIQAFRKLMRLKNTMRTFAEFEWEQLAMDEQTFEDYKSKYLDLYDKARQPKEKVSVLDDVDFELELIHRDQINVAYILRLLAELKNEPQGESEEKKKAILDLIGGEATLRSKRELIEKFIEENLPQIRDTDTIPDEFDVFWEKETQEALTRMIDGEGLSRPKTVQKIKEYLHTPKTIQQHEALDMLQKQPSILLRKKIGQQIINAFNTFFETFIHNTP
ncbi:type I restriction endonuclease (plasmid) [Fulvitalea axinellae]|uniref:Type I restriction enzyme endonuclease subunit n=1 Tax=Fulvitalea axinellae TaxID=1182444 RepID=A0AAU9CVF5_9BACT|nr:type I restriction endonuclease [Fulvitalea axinellae]